MAAGLCRAIGEQPGQVAHADPVRAQEQDVARSLDIPAQREPGQLRQAGRARRAAAWPPPRGRPRGGAGQPRHGGRPAGLPAAGHSADPRRGRPPPCRWRHPRRTERGRAAAPAAARPPGPRPGPRDVRSPARVGGEHVGLQGRQEPLRIGELAAEQAPARAEVGLSPGQGDRRLGERHLVSAVRGVGCQQFRRRQRVWPPHRPGNAGRYGGSPGWRLVAGPQPRRRRPDAGSPARDRRPPAPRRPPAGRRR